MFIRALSFFLSSGLTFAASYPAITYSTYLRDSFTPKAIATDASGNVYMVGNAIVDPATSQTTVLVVKLNPQGTQYLYVRYVGGSVNDYANAIAVDSAGNVYVAGSTASPDFPNTANFATAASAQSIPRSFVAKLDPNGNLIFSNLLGGSSTSSAMAVAVNSSGQVVVTGEIVGGSAGPSFPGTAGAYSGPATFSHPYLLELDPTGTKIIFSATGIGGSALAFDSSGNIYVAGTTYLLDYPTTPGAYQTTFPVFAPCLSPSCFAGSQGPNQYVSKVDPTGAKLIYSTALTGSGSTTNGGLAVDASGNAYVTGYAAASYPYTVTVPSLPVGEPFVIQALPFLSKLDPAGATLLFSVAAGGSGVSLDGHGNVYTGGGIGSPGNNFNVPSSVPALANVPAACLANGTSISDGAYVAQFDASSGNLEGSQYIWGSTLVPNGTALSGSTLWIAGATNYPTVPFTPSALTLPSFGPGPLPGAYVGAVNFSQTAPPAGTPQIGCIIDSADYALAGAAARYQMLSIMGTNLGPSTGVNATDSMTTTLGGVSVNVGGMAAPLLYASSTQINFAVPLVPSAQSFATMQLTVNGTAASMLEIPLTYANPSLFINGASAGSFGFVVTALNADGSLNSSSNPAQLGSTISVFVNGLTQNPDVTNAPLLLSSINGWTIKSTTQATPFLLQVNLGIPSQLENNFGCAISGLCEVQFSIFDDEEDFSTPPTINQAIPSISGVVYINRGQ